MWILIAAIVASAPPRLPAPFADLEGMCITPKCGLRVYAPKGSGLKLDPQQDGGGMQHLGVVAVAPGQLRCLAYDPGPSEDPSLAVLPAKVCSEGWKDGTEPELSAGGELLIVTGNGILYTSGSSNAKFEIRQKWVRNPKGEWAAVPQPFHYVGRTVKVPKETVLGEKVAPLKLLTDKNANAEVVATIAPGQTVEILLADNGATAKWFLVRTEFGLVGWWASPQDGIVPDALGIYFHGD